MHLTDEQVREKYEKIDEEIKKLQKEIEDGTRVFKNSGINEDNIVAFVDGIENGIITELDLDENKSITNAAVGVLSGAIRRSTTFFSLSVRKCDVENLGFADLVFAMETCATFRKLKIFGNRITVEEINRQQPTICNLNAVVDLVPLMTCPEPSNLSPVTKILRKMRQGEAFFVHLHSALES